MKNVLPASLEAKPNNQKLTKEQLTNMRFSVNKEDLLRGKTVPPGWYLCEIRDVHQEAAKTDGSLNTNVEFVILEGQYAGIPIDRSFNEKPKARPFAISFLEALLGRKMKPEGEDLDLTNAKGRKIRVYVKNEQFQNRLINKAEDFQTAV